MKNTSTIELHLVCIGSQPPHEFVKTFDGEPNWTEVVQALKLDRCDMHPELSYCDWE